MIHTFLWVGIFQLMGYSNAHAIYLSVLELKYQPNGTEITVKVFSDDLNDALYNLTKERDNFGADCTKSKKSIMRYFSRYLKININGQPQNLRWAGCEINDDATWIRFLAANSGKFKKIEVKADYLMELFPTQTNVVNIQSGDKKRFLKLTIDQKEGSVDF